MSLENEQEKIEYPRPYELYHSNVDGGGFIKGYETQGDAIQAADTEQKTSDYSGNFWVYIYHVYHHEREIYTSRPNWTIINQRRKEIERVERSKELTPQMASSVFFASFLYAQDDTELQHDFFAYFHWIRQQWAVTGECQAAMALYFVEILRDMESSGQHANLDIFTNSSLVARMEAEIQAMTDIFAQPVPTKTDRNRIIASIMRMMIARDYTYLIEKGARPKNQALMSPYERSNPSIYADPQRTFFCRYVLLGEKTTVPEFTELFSDIQTHIETGSPLFKQIRTEQYGETYRQLEAIIRFHNDRSKNKVDLTILRR